MNCSDSHNAFICNKCGGLLTVYPVITSVDHVVQSNVGNDRYGFRQQYCISCKSSEGIRPVQLPYVYRYVGYLWVV